MKFPLGLVVGKFHPPHLGHKLLIDAAAEQSEQTVVFVCAKPTDLIPGDLRRQWLQEIHPTTCVRLIDDRDDEQDLRVWAANTIAWLGRAPDAVFTSEDYGDRYAAWLGAKHIAVDKLRRQVAISGTAVRSDPYANWAFIGPPVRGWFAKRVCIVGAESTGTTTLARALAEALQTVWVSEYGREYSELKRTKSDVGWRTEEFAVIAREQMSREDTAARKANRILICDTNGFATNLWHRRYVGHSSPTVEEITRPVRCDLYLLTGDEIPFVADGLRDGEGIRHEMHGWFEEALAAQPVPWQIVRGSHERRMEEALGRIRGLFSESKWRPGG